MTCHLYHTSVLSCRQAVPPDHSQYVSPISDTQWQCKKCPFIIMSAVMSSGCIQHFKKEHPELVDGLKFELCKVRNLFLISLSTLSLSLFLSTLSLSFSPQLLCEWIAVFWLVSERKVVTDSNDL